MPVLLEDNCFPEECYDYNSLPKLDSISPSGETMHYGEALGLFIYWLTPQF